MALNHKKIILKLVPNAHVEHYKDEEGNTVHNIVNNGDLPGYLFGTSIFDIKLHDDKTSIDKRFKKVTIYKEADEA